MGFKQYTMPLRDSVSGKWVFQILDEDEQLIESIECDTEEAALRHHKERFIKNVLSNDVPPEVK